MKRKNVTCVKELFNCIALMSVTSFVGLEKCFWSYTWRCGKFSYCQTSGRKVSWNSQSLSVCNKVLYKKVLKTVWDDDTVPAMKRERNLPAVLSRDEINTIIDATPNLKHKAIIATMYSSGLRVSEVVHLHYDDISRTTWQFMFVKPKAELTGIQFCLKRI